MTPGRRNRGTWLRRVRAVVTLGTIAVVTGCAGSAPASSAPASSVPASSVPASSVESSSSTEPVAAVTVSPPSATPEPEPTGDPLTPATPTLGPDGPEWPNDVARVADALRAAFPDDFSTARVDLTAGTGTVTFEGDVPAGAAAIAAAVPQVRLVGDAGFSEADLSEATNATLTAVQAAFTPPRSLGAEADQETGRILIVVGPALDPAVVVAPPTAGELAAARSAALAAHPLPPGLTLELEFAAGARFGVGPQSATSGPVGP